MTSYPSDSQQTCDWEPYEGNKECRTKLIHSQRIPRGIKGMAWDFEGVRTGRNKKGAEGSSNQGLLCYQWVRLQGRDVYPSDGQRHQFNAKKLSVIAI